MTNLLKIKIIIKIYDTIFTRVFIVYYLKKIKNKFWWRYRDSNPGPIDYDSTALTD